MRLMTFTSLYQVAKRQEAAVKDGEPPGTNDGAEAVLVAAALFDWVMDNATEAQKIEVGQAVSKALNL